MIMNKLITGPWNLTDLKEVKSNGLKVFSCFHCGGGSTMGYKLAGYEVLGGVEIDPKMMEIYRANHNPKNSYLMGVQDFKNIPDKDLPKELFNLDILDGSPPCSSFSMAGSREDGWQEEKVFREGQANQILDDLFFDFIDIAKKLQPKVVISENVKGLVSGKARGYVKQIFKKFRDAGYSTQLFLLNSSRMGVPQKRERVFFVSNRIGKKINLNFNELPISIKDTMGEASAAGKREKAENKCAHYWKMCKRGKSFASVHEKGSYFSKIKIDPLNPAPTITGYSHSDLYHWEECANLNEVFFKRVQTFPEDYNFINQEPGYVCGMSVPPFMMQRVADQVYKQMFNDKPSLVENEKKTSDTDVASST